MGLREEILREFVTKYQIDHSHIVFEKILMRVDYLLANTVHMLVKSRP